MQLYEHQKQALRQTRKFDNVLYALDMGLGKTYISTEQAFNVYNNSVCLIVCQKSKIDDWIKHVEENYHTKKVFDLTNKKDLPRFLASERNKVGVINYELIYRRDELLAINECAFTLILDESSLIQNETTKRTKFILKLKPANTILLSGTVVNGNYEKLWSQCHLLGWEIKKKMFWAHYVKTRKIKRNGFWINIVTGYKNVDRLKSKLREHGSVFMKTDEVLSLPSQNFNYINCKNTNEYWEFERDKVIEINGRKLIADYELTERMIKRQLAGVYNPNRIKAFEDLLDSTADRLVVFYNFNVEYDVLKNVVLSKGKPISVVNGKVKDLKNYEEKQDSVTLIQYGAGSFGLNLQKANKCIYFSLPDGASEKLDQSIKRIHRIGQERPCFYYFMLTENSIDDEIVENLKIKQKRRDFLWK